mgnify:CR=1 FL=1
MHCSRWQHFCLQHWPNPSVKRTGLRPAAYLVRYAREHYAVNASGTSSSMKNVSREVVLALPVPLPPLAEQSRIVTRVTALRRLCADLRQRLAERQSVQARLAEALVQEVA